MVPPVVNQVNPHTSQNASVPRHEKPRPLLADWRLLPAGRKTPALSSRAPSPPTITVIAWRSNYTYKIHDEIRELDAAGGVKSVHSTLDEVLYIGGKRYFRPLEKDDKPIARRRRA